MSLDWVGSVSTAAVGIAAIGGAAWNTRAGHTQSRYQARLIDRREAYARYMKTVTLLLRIVEESSQSDESRLRPLEDNPLYGRISDLHVEYLSAFMDITLIGGIEIADQIYLVDLEIQEVLNQFPDRDMRNQVLTKLVDLMRKELGAA